MLYCAGVGFSRLLIVGWLGRVLNKRCYAAHFPEATKRRDITLTYNPLNLMEYCEHSVRNVYRPADVKTIG